MRKKHITALIAAGGKGSRMGAGISKQYMILNGKPVILHSLEKFQECSLINEIIIIVSDNNMDFSGFKKINSVVAGGPDRQSSVYNGLKKISKETDIVLIHDAARPLIKIKDIERLIVEAMEYPNCTLGVPVKDTIKMADKNRFAIDTPDRRFLYAIQTPQAFAYNVIMEAHEKALEDGFKATDDTMLAEYIGIKTKIIEGSYDNIKITTQEDLIIAKAFLSEADNL